MTNISSLEVLAAARIVADYAYSQGVERATISHRLSYSHLGAVLADSILQAGVNYNFVVRPRVERILKLYPNASCGDGLFFIIDSGTSSEFLCWSHNEKVVRFEKVVSLLRTGGITSADELANRLKQNGFRDELHALRGIGPKTIDYMSCLVGIDCVAVDRHCSRVCTRCRNRNRRL